MDHLSWWKCFSMFFKDISVLTANKGCHLPLLSNVRFFFFFSLKNFIPNYEGIRPVWRATELEDGPHFYFSEAQRKPVKPVGLPHTVLRIKAKLFKIYNTIGKAFLPPNHLPGKATAAVACVPGSWDPCLREGLKSTKGCQEVCRGQPCGLLWSSGIL